MKLECTFARIQMEARDGHIHAFSDEVPGLNICGKDREVVLRDVVRGIKFLFKEVRGINVDVQWVEKQNPLLPPARTKDSRDLTLQLSEPVYA